MTSVLMAALLLCLPLSPACGDRSEPRPAGHWSAAAPLQPTAPIPPPPVRARVLSDPRMAEASGLLDRLIDRPEAFIETGWRDRVGLARAERFFMLLGRLAELLDLYRSAVASDGAASPFAPRLALFYTTLGYRSEASALLDPALEAQPENPDSHLAAAYWLLTRDPLDEAGRQQALRHLLQARELEEGTANLSIPSAVSAARLLDEVTPEERMALGGDLLPWAHVIVERSLAAATAVMEP